MEGGWPLPTLLNWMHPPPLASLTSQEQSPSNFNLHGDHLKSLLNALLGP